MLITEILARNARMYAAETALVERHPANGVRREITWGAFDAQANRLARALMAKGIGKGDRVVQLMMNSLEWLPVYFGILRTGAWAVPLNFRFVAKTIGRCTRTAGARGDHFRPGVHRTPANPSQRPGVFPGVLYLHRPRKPAAGLGRIRHRPVGGP